MPLFRRRPEDISTLMVKRQQLLAEIEAVEADVAWTAASDDNMELAESRRLRRQADALRRSLADLDERIVAAGRASL
ncbi:MAG TPA: hypothetical protein VF230_13190 [Acidimicrobiales bacterium]